MRNMAAIEDIRVAVTDYDCTSYKDIAILTGRSVPNIAQALSTLRRPEVAEALGFTIPHVRRGPTERVYHVVTRGDGEDLSPFVDDEFVPGAVATLCTIATSGENEGYALREIAKHGTPAQARVLRRAAVAIEGAAALARDMAETLA